jgi:thioredoxin-like negative regulator of GroEL
MQSSAVAVVQEETVIMSADPVPSVPANTVSNNNDITVLLNQVRQNPRDARLALQVAEAYKASGAKEKAMEWYRKVLQLDVMQPSGIDRMAVYDAMADMQ